MLQQDTLTQSLPRVLVNAGGADSDFIFGRTLSNAFP